MAKERKAWQIMAKQKHENEWYLEKFMTGGKSYFSFSEAQHDKNALKEMSHGGFNYKVVKIQ